jgi:hypothetical protein
VTAEGTSKFGLVLLIANRAMFGTLLWLRRTSQVKEAPALILLGHARDVGRMPVIASAIVLTAPATDALRFTFES